MTKRTIKPLDTEPSSQDFLFGDSNLNQTSSSSDAIRLDKGPKHFERSFGSVQEAIGAIAHDLILARGFITNKDIILQLIVQLEFSKDLPQKELLRDALQAVVSATPDDA